MINLEENLRQYFVEKSLECNREYEKAREEKRYTDKTVHEAKRQAYADGLRFIIETYKTLRGEKKSS